MRQSEQNVSPMSNQGRNSYVIEHITNAFLTLLKEKPIENISISDLTNLAGVGRASFYRNFKRKEDILISYISQLFDEWIHENNNDSSIPLSEKVRTMIVHFENHRSFYELLNKRGLTYLLKDVIVKYMGSVTDQEMLQAYSSSFVAYTLYGWIDTWFQRGMTETSDEIYEMFKAQGL